MKKKAYFFVYIFLIFIFIENISLGASSYIWSDTSSLQTTSSTTNSTDLKLESGGAILMEQSSRHNFI